MKCLKNKFYQYLFSTIIYFLDTVTGFQSVGYWYKFRMFNEDIGFFLLIICFWGNKGKVVIIAFQNCLAILMLLKNTSKINKSGFFRVLRWMGSLSNPFSKIIHFYGEGKKIIQHNFCFHIPFQRKWGQLSSAVIDTNLHTVSLSISFKP